MKNCFIFSGQGSHRPGMSLNLYNTFQIAKDRIELSNKILGYDISEIMFSAQENVLRQTQYAQPAIFIHSTILFDLIKDQNECVAVAGHSLGEFSALYANNFFDFETGLKIVDVRARAMHECELNYPGKMSAVIGTSIDKIQSICDSVDCQIANINSDYQIVISGSEESIDLASENLKDIGSKVIPLSVSGAFHSKLMSEAKNQLIDIINTSSFNEVCYPIVSNFNAKPNISIEEKWSIEGEKESVDLFKSKNKEYSSKSKDKDILSVVFWPEVFLPGLKSKYTEVINELEFYISKSNFASVFGVLSKNNGADGVNNSLMSLGKLNGKFDKQKLVPFGEYVPFSIFNSFFSFFNFNRPNIVPSDNNVLIKSKNLNISSAICYEIAYQDIFLKHGEQSNLLFNASNDNWFGNTIGPYQHLQIARYRAAENRKPLVRSTSTGVSALIDKFGNVVKRIDLDNSDQSVKNSQLIEANIFSRSGHTPFITFGKWPSIIFILIVIFCSFFNKILKNEKY